MTLNRIRGLENQPRESGDNALDCNPLPTGQQKWENRAKIDRDWIPEKREKRASTGRSPVGRIALWLLFSTKRLWGVGSWLGDAGRGPQESPSSGKQTLRRFRNAFWLE